MFNQIRMRGGVNLKFISTILFAVTFLVGGFFVATGTAFAATVASQVDQYTQTGNDSVFTRSLTAGNGSTVSQTTNPDGSVVVNINNATGYADSGFYTKPMKLGDVKSVTVTGSGSFGVNIWLDTNTLNDSTNSKFFTWNSNGNVFVSTDGDGFFSAGPAPVSNTLTINDTSNFDSYTSADTGTHTLAWLKTQHPNADITFWVGVTVMGTDISRSKSATITAFDVVAPVPMAINSSLPTFTAGVESAFTVGTVANDDAGDIVRAYFTIPTEASVTYEEQGGSYLPLINVFGPETGFPVSDLTSNFKATFDTAGTYTVTVDFKLLNGTLVATKNITATVVAAPVPTHTVTFDANSGSGSMSAQTTNVSTALTANAFTRTGYTFAGWNTVALGSGTSYADGASYDFSADVTLYAQWTAIPSSGGGGGHRATPAIPANVTTPEGCLAGDKFSRTTGRNCNAATPAVPAGQVLGANTQAGQVLGAASFNFTKFLKNNSKGDEVMEVQKFLNTLGHNCGTADGKFGPKTKACVIKFQLANKLKGDGVVGALTRVFLNK